MKAQKRGGKGKTGISTREEDFVVQIFTANTHTPVLFFSTQGLAYRIKAYKIPEGTAASVNIHRMRHRVAEGLPVDSSFTL